MGRALHPPHPSHQHETTPRQGIHDLERIPGRARGARMRAERSDVFPEEHRRVHCRVSEHHKKEALTGMDPSPGE